VASALVGRALICSFVSCGRLPAILPVSHLGLQPINLLGARHVVSLTASILAGLAMPGNRPTHSRRPTVPDDSQPLLARNAVWGPLMIPG
jgi:hypothetical protein